MTNQRKRKKITKLKGNTLIYVLLFVLLISIVISSLVYAAYFNQKQILPYQISNRLVDNAISGINLLQVSEVETNTNKDLYGDGKEIVNLQYKNWGLFQIGIATARSQLLHRRKIALFGYTLPPSLDALYLCDNSKELSLAGKTLIRGNSSIPNAEVKRAYINNDAFAGSKLIHGEVKKSAKVLPPIQFTPFEKPISFSNTRLEEKLITSFADTTSIIHTPSVLMINQELRGNIVLSSREKIIITRNSKLEDVIITAPEVLVEDGFQGNIQIFATDKIQIGKDCFLRYPSAIVLKGENTQKALLEIKAGTELHGCIITSTNNHKRNNIEVLIEKEVMIRGFIHNAGIIDFKGKIQGSLYTQALQLKTRTALYDNHLINATIDAISLEDNFAVPYLFISQTDKKIAKWLY